MPLKNKALLLAGALALSAPFGANAAIHLNPFHHKNKATPADDTVAQPAPTPTAPAAAATSSQTQYDEVGYATIGNSGGISLAHPSLPAPSFVELTNLDTGKTILAVVTVPLPTGRLIATLSPQALTMLGGQPGQSLALRVRRVNPPQQEQAALLAGQPASDRLDTPPMLLGALKRKLSESHGLASSDGAAANTPDLTNLQPVAPTRPALAKPALVAKPIVVAKPAPPRPSRAATVTQASSDARFIVENAGAPSDASPMTKPTHKPIVKEMRAAQTDTQTPSVATVSASFYLQIASLSSEANANALAAKLGASAIQAGAYWHVRKGPYSSEAQAQAALGPLAAKGYRGIRITH